MTELTLFSAASTGRSRGRLALLAFYIDTVPNKASPKESLHNSLTEGPLTRSAGLVPVTDLGTFRARYASGPSTMPRGTT